MRLDQALRLMRNLTGPGRTWRARRRTWSSNTWLCILDARWVIYCSDWRGPRWEVVKMSYDPHQHPVTWDYDFHWRPDPTDFLDDWDVTTV